MTDEEEQENLNYVREHDSYTSPTIDDVDFFDDGLYFGDCWNVDYCKKYRKRKMKFRCLRGAKGSRCTRAEKEEIRAEGLNKRFNFPNS